MINGSLFSCRIVQAYIVDTLIGQNNFTNISMLLARDVALIAETVSSCKTMETTDVIVLKTKFCFKTQYRNIVLLPSTH